MVYLLSFFDGFDHLRAVISIVSIYLLLLLAIVCFRNGVNVISITYVFAIVPSLTPFFTYLLGFDRFTTISADLQQPDLIVVSLVMAAIFATTFLIGQSRLEIPVRGSPMFGERFRLNKLTWIFVIVVNCVLLYLFLEAGTFFDSAYHEIKRNTSGLSSTVNQIANLSVALLALYLVDKKSRHYMLFLVFVVFAISILYSTRTLAISASVVAIYMLGMHGRQWRTVVAVALVAAALLFIGYVRNVSLLGYFSGTAPTQLPDEIFVLPGGASHVYISVLGYLESLRSGDLGYPYSFPIVLWPSGIIESNIYKDFLGHPYSGGMLITTVIAWNFGLVGLAVIGYFFGWFVRRCHIELRAIAGIEPVTYFRAFAVIYVMLLPNILWYSPYALVKPVIALCLFYLVIRTKRHLLSVRRSARSQTGDSRLQLS